ncbi:MAG: UDP-N-acetylglucosamine 2-epimerase [Candidatus Bathyarchaeia archaeon]|jgi:UDP-hydrolysing UDP-N-acetyl-D-glucosamine 2-epimerase
MKPREIAVVTGSRAEYGMLKPLLEKIQKSKRLRLRLVVTGMHLLREHGLTLREIEKDGFKPAAKVPMYSGDSSQEEYFGKSLARGIAGLSEALKEIRPDLLVVLGDRLESLAATLAAATLRIPIAHVEAGDKTDSGHIDEPIRHSITRFANVLFAATLRSAKRLIEMGEESWRVHRVGALGLDAILNYPPISEKKLAEKFHLDTSEPYALVVFHPVHLEKESAGRQMREVIDALKELKPISIIIYPNNDPGSEHIIAEIEKSRNLPFVRIYRNLPHDEYVSLLKHAGVLVGNSSSGIIEAPSLGIPVVNVGSRNVGREHAQNVIFVPPRKNPIINAIKKALHDYGFRKSLRKRRNPYGDGKASERIVRVLANVQFNTKLLQKRVTY